MIAISPRARMISLITGYIRTQMYSLSDFNGGTKFTFRKTIFFTPGKRLVGSLLSGLWHLLQIKFSPLDSINHEFISSEIASWVHHFEKRYSRYLSKSWLSLVNKSAGIKAVKFTDEDQPILRAAQYSFFKSNQA